MLNVRDEILALIADAIKEGGCIPAHDPESQTIYFVNDRHNFGSDAKLMYQFTSGAIGIKLFIRDDITMGTSNDFDKFEIGDALNFGMLLCEITSASDECKCDPTRV